MFARLLNEQIPYNARVVEVGCGTGQLTNFLTIAHRSVLGVDICLNSLRLASKFKEENSLTRAAFAQMNLFRPALKDGFFDVVISNGVLHHTGDCRGAFHRISRLVRPGGHFVVGLYNAYSRKFHYARVALFRFTGVTSSWLDPHFNKVSADGKREAWFQDQYCHPHETCHTIERSYDLDGRVRNRVRQLHSQAGAGVGAGRRRELVRSARSRHGVEPDDEPACLHRQRLP